MEKITDKHPDSASLNVVQDNISQLKQLFPELITEDASGAKIDVDVLKELVGEQVIDGDKERYNFTWHGKAAARRLAQTPSTGTLRPCKEESKDWDTTQNLFIEGDNLEVLKLLQKSYHKKVKMIYIDPPYNTGKDFIYPDNYRDNIKNYLELTGQVGEEGQKLSANSETSGRYHTHWLNMMYPRLKLAHNLLANNGVIFVSIDFRESNNLRLIMNEVFGEDNFIFEVSIVNNLKGRNDREGIATCHEQLLIYSKPEYVARGLSLTDDKVSEYKEKDENGSAFQWRDLRKRGGADTRKERPKMFFPLYINPETGAAALKESSTFSIEVYPKKSNGDDGCWRWGKEKVEAHVSNLRGTQAKGKSHWNISYRVYLFSDGEQRRSTPKSTWFGPKFSTDSGSKALAHTFPGIISKEFTPKPVGLMQDIIDQSTDEGDIILDFFSGTGTSFIGCLQQNVIENIQRRFIAVQMPEPILSGIPKHENGLTTISNLAKERIRRCSKKLTAKNSKLDTGFKVFKLDSSNIKPWDADFDNLEQMVLGANDSLKPDRTADDVLYEILLKYGLDLTLPIQEHTLANKTVYNIGFGALMICLDNAIDLDVVNAIGELKKELQPEVMRVVFKDAGFANDVVKTNAIQVLKQFGIDDVKSI